MLTCTTLLLMRCVCQRVMLPYRHWAAAQGNAAVLAVLIDGGADLDARDESERTALHYTAARGHTEAAATLIAAIVASAVGNSLAGLEALSGRGTTPLQLASEHGARSSEYNNMYGSTFVVVTCVSMPFI